ncbi:metacaspase-9-like [Gossypium australe]|uniref:Metacaspase-9-like n=1 Tax=Gossypium australe TaxID=47621 RepID=A0A5B6WBZ2_9ROSI|nr:metacaspase-9-like [Gossypium australe]
MSKGTKRAVLVGCNYPKAQFSLHGCINDVEAIRGVILNFGFHESDVNVLTDAPGSSILPTDVSLKFHPHYVNGLMVLDPLEEDEGILLSGCEANETSYDVVLGNRAFGAFTHAVVTVLGKHKGISNRELMVEAARILKNQGFDQNPCLYCSDENTNATFLGDLA